MYSLLLLFLLLSLSSQSQLADDIIDSSKTEGELIKAIDSNMSTLEKESGEFIEKLLLSSHYKALQHYVEELNERGIKFRESLSSAITKIKNKYDEILSEYDKIGKDVLIASPAFQWAQSMDSIFIEVKFASRFDSPGCVEVNGIHFTHSKEGLVLKGECSIEEHIMKYELDLKLLNSVDEEYEETKEISGGKFQITLKKKVAKYWERLLKDENAKIDNMKIWFEMKSKYEDELKEYEKNENEDKEKSFEEIERELKEERKRNKKKKNGKKGKKTKKEKKTDL